MKVTWMLDALSCWDVDTAQVLFPSFINLTGTNICVYAKLFLGVAGYWVPSIPCQCIVAMVDVAHSFVLATYPSL